MTHHVLFTANAVEDSEGKKNCVTLESVILRIPDSIIVSALESDQPTLCQLSKLERL